MFKKLFGGGSKEPVNAPDFSSIDSVEKAIALMKQGQLEKLHLFPIEYGGEDIPPNVTYVPVGVAQAKTQLDGTIAKMVEAGTVSQYNAAPEYKGRSFIPSRINIRAWHPERAGEFTYTIEVW